MIHYLPSCKIKSNHSEASQKIQSYLSKKGIIIEGCCKLSQNNFHNDDIVLTNCTSCSIITNEQSPFVKEMSLYEYLLTDESFPWPDLNKKAFTVQDCYRTIHKPQVQKAIRECLKKMNATIVELEENLEKTKFDGTFKYSPVPQPTLNAAPQYYSQFNEHFVEILDQDQQKAALETWDSQYETEDVIVYCNSCEKGVSIGGIKPTHIIELLALNL